MYSKAEYASWLNATYGFSESIRELVPILNVPPAFACDVPPLAEYAAIASATIPSAGTASHFLIRRPPCSSLLERGLLQRERLPVGVERIPDAERNGSEMLPVSERQLVEDRHAERLELLLEHVLERARARPIGRL